MAFSTAVPMKGAVRHPVFHGSGGSLFGIQIVNLLLTILTLGIYSFWGKVRVRKYLYNQTEFFGDRFAYHGTGRELFIGAIKAFVILLGIYGGVIVLAAAVHQGLILLIYPVILIVIPVALYGAMRYGMSRTSWRGIRFSFRGRLKECMGKYIGGMLLTLLTLGLYYPFFHEKMRGYWVRNTYFGDTPFEYNGRGKDLMGSFILAVILALPTLYLYLFWYMAKVERYDWAHTRFANGDFDSTVTGGAILGQTLGNILLILFTLGIALPWVITRTIQFHFRFLGLKGDLDIGKIQRGSKSGITAATGEGLASALDMGSALG